MGHMAAAVGGTSGASMGAGALQAASAECARFHGAADMALMAG